MPRASRPRHRIRNDGECSAERPFAVGDLGQAEPRIFSRCLPVDPALEDDYNEIVWNVKADGTFEASVEISNMVVAANGSRSAQRPARQE